MKDIKCPSCGKTFRIDPSSFEEILLQIKDEEFNKQIKERLILAEEDNKKALEILKRELKIQLIEQNRIKETEIQTLESKLNIAEEKKEKSQVFYERRLRQGTRRWSSEDGLSYL